MTSSSSKHSTVRLIYPDWVSGGLSTYWWGSKVLERLIPENNNQQVLHVDIPQPHASSFQQTLQLEQGIAGLKHILLAHKQAEQLLEKSQADHVITLGGSCWVSHAPFDYLHKLYPHAGIIWIDAHPDVSHAQHGYPMAHAMVLADLMGHGDEAFTSLRQNDPFAPSDILYVGLQQLLSPQQDFLTEHQICAVARSADKLDGNAIEVFARKHNQVLVHLDIDVLSPHLFHDTYFAAPNAEGDGSGAGVLRIEQVSRILTAITQSSEMIGFTIAEYLPFSAEKLAQLLYELPIFTT
ncbi:arginase family protein [Collinsella sp. zg1085]|uniref:arginase family protein n=1 Tax=Collinsella sp. zg1085 TaxID=2844380 RepID=UPI001C0CA7FF|nr:arginase family protein [Collinsella sp. zg1085]QWT17339.1 arginase family protein [Collinsella sp. zg1085]